MRNFLLAITLIISLISCTKSNEDKVQENIKEYFSSNIKQDNISIEFDKFSRLYILDPLDASVIPKATNQYESTKNAFLLFNSIRLTINGCTPDNFKRVIDNDKTFSKLRTGGRSYLMLSFFTITDKYHDEFETGYCVVLDSLLKVERLHNIHNYKEIIEMSISDKDQY